VIRIVAGRFRGRQLKAPAGLETRPTGARVRKALFDILGPRLEGARVADLFAGTGALGFEALSRGAEHVDFHEHGRAALTVLQANVAMLGVADEVTIVAGPLPDSLKPGPPYDLILLDPPWRRGLELGVVTRLLALGRIHADSVVVIERDTRDTDVDAALGAAGLERIDQRPYGDTTLCLFQRRSAPTEPSAP
jgi:16S rRNA (guanine966-N2)-methyltransferase